jgi:uncharacterized protein DUF6275
MKLVKFKPEKAEEWGVRPYEVFLVAKDGPLSAFIWFRGRKVHVSKTCLITLEDRMADTDIRPLVEPSPHLDKAKAIVWDYVMSHLDKSDPIPDFKVYEVTFSYTLGNWKAMISTTLPDKMYYEVTYDRDNKCTYLDAYIKLDNKKIMDETNAQTI